MKKVVKAREETSVDFLKYIFDIRDSKPEQGQQA